MPRWKRWALYALVVALVAGAGELMAKAAGMAIEGRRFSRARLQAQREALVASAGRVSIGANVRWGRDEVLHPYVGYVPGPGGDGAAGSLGFAAREPIQRRAADRVIIAVVGGSIAHLAELPAFRGRTFVPLNLAVAGYKQPQQLMTVVYLLALGGELDIVVNLDGFNDVTMHPTENAAKAVSPHYPRRWDQRVEGLFQGGTLRLMLERAQTEQRRASLAASFSAWPWRLSNMANVIYLALDRRLEQRQAATDRELLGAPADGSTIPSGPRMTFASDREMYQHLAELWQRSSLQLARLAEANGIRYYHFLQPNQYLAGAKPMGAAERAQALVAGHPYQRAVESGYPLLQRAGRILEERGVRFTDLTAVFGGRPEPIYFDSCCHVNEHGNAILADQMFQAIRRDLERPAAR